MLASLSKHVFMQNNISIDECNIRNYSVSVVASSRLSREGVFISDKKEKAQYLIAIFGRRYDRNIKM